MTDTATVKATFQAAIDALGLTVESVFVPWSQSRNKDEKDERGNSRQSLNWKVTLKRNGREIMTTDYGAGIAHCPSYKPNAGWTLDYTALIEFEVEQGYPAQALASLRSPMRKSGSKPILPDTLDVIHSLIMDSDVIDYPTFEKWAENFGYDADSRKGEAIYRACLEIALKLRAGIGDAGIEALRIASQDY